MHENEWRICCWARRRINVFIKTSQCLPLKESPYFCIYCFRSVLCKWKCVTALFLPPTKSQRGGTWALMKYRAAVFFLHKPASLLSVFRSAVGYALAESLAIGIQFAAKPQHHLVLYLPLNDKSPWVLHKTLFIQTASIVSHAECEVSSILGFQRLFNCL